jgi:hypothetical protein
VREENVIARPARSAPPPPLPARSARVAPAAAYLILAAAWCWPLPLHLSTRFAHDPGDPLLNTFLLWWNARVIPLSPAMWNAPFYWPMHDALALTEHEAGIGLLGTPIQWLGGSPLLAYNLILIATVWWSALAMHALVRRLTGSSAAAWCAALIWSLAPYRASQLAHLQLLVTWWMPIALLALHAYYEDGRRRWLLLFGAAWLLQALSNGYYMFFFPLIVAGWLAAMTPWRTNWRRAAAVMGTWIVFSLPLLPVLLEYYTVQRALDLFRTREEMQMFSARWSSFVHYSPLLRFWRYYEPRTQEDFLFPGVAAFAMVAAALAIARRRTLTRPFLFYMGAAIVCTWLAAGPSSEQWSLASLWHVYDWIAWLPGYSGLRVPARFFMLTTLCLAIAAGLAVAALGNGRGRAVAAAGCLLAFVDGWILPMPLGAPPRPFGTPLAANARVLELPVDDDNINVQAMYRETLHGLPVVNGYAGYVPPHMSVIAWGLRRFDPSILTELRRGRPLYVVVANHPMAAAWTAFMDAQPDAQMIGISGAGRLYAMAAAPFPPQVAVGAPLANVHGDASDDWLTFDLGTPRTVRALDVETRGYVHNLPPTIVVETSPDGRSWTKTTEEPPGALALAGALRQPLAVPLRLLLPDPARRFLRINTPAFSPGAVTIYGP